MSFILQFSFPCPLINISINTVYLIPLKQFCPINSNRQSIIPPGRHLVGRGHSVRGAVRASPVRQLQPGGAGGEDQRGAAGQPASGADRHRGLSGLRHQMSPAGSSQQVARASFFHVLSLDWVYLFCTGPGNVPHPSLA
jgi:hypothetical protein